MPASIKVAIHVIDLFGMNTDQRSWLHAQIAGANEVFADAQMEFNVTSEAQNLFNEGICDIGECNLGDTPTSDQAIIFDTVSSEIPADEFIVFVAKGLLPNMAAGCAWHPPDRRGCVVTAREDLSSPEYTLAHELGHLLGLEHVENNNHRLMYPSVGWAELPPLLSQREIDFLNPGEAQPSSENGQALILNDDEELLFRLQLIEPDLSRLARRGPSLIPALENIYAESKCGEVKARATYLLSLLDDSPDTNSVLRKAVESRDVLMRIACAHGLTRSDHQRSKSLLEELKKDLDKGVRRIAGRIGLKLRISRSSASRSRPVPPPGT
jgi:hypothetical protein